MTKQRYTITMDPEIRELADKVADHQGRNFSNLLEWLIKEKAAQLKIK